MNTEITRNPRWDNAKAGLIFLVVLGHLAEQFTGSSALCRGLFSFIYLFHMPAFFFLSGMLGKRTIDSEKFRADKIVPLLLLCIFFNFLRFMTNFFWDRDVVFKMFRLSNASWYLFSLCACYMLAWLVRKISPVYVLVISIVCSLILGYDDTLGALFALYRIVTFFPFFYLGYMIDPNRLERRLQKPTIRMIGLLILILFGLICLIQPDRMYQWRKLITGANSYYQLPLDVNMFSWTLRVVYYLLAGLIGTCFLAIIPGRTMKIVSVIGQRTLAIYLFHQLLVEPLVRLDVFLRLMRGGASVELTVLVLCAAGIVLLTSWKPLSVAISAEMQPGRRSRPS